MTSLKLKWNKERFGDINNQSAGQIYPQSLNTILEKEKALIDIGQLLSPSNNSLQSQTNRGRETLESQRPEFGKQTFSQQHSTYIDPKVKIEVRSYVSGNENSKFSSPKSSLYGGGDQAIKVFPKELAQTQVKKQKFDSKAKNTSLEIEADSDMQLFNRMRPPREYSSKQEEILKKHKDIPIESSIHFFTPKKSASKKQTFDGSKPTSTRGSSIQVLKRKVFDTRFEEDRGYPGTAQKGHSIEIDKPQNILFSQSTLGTIPSLTSIADKKPTMCSLASPSSRKAKPLSMDKMNLIYSENIKAADSKKVPVNFHVSKLLDRPQKNENSGYYFAPGMRLSIKSRGHDTSKSTSMFQAISPKADQNDENYNVFRVIGIVPAKTPVDNARSSVGESRNKSKEFHIRS